MATASKRRYTLEEYIALEERSEERHEFYRGEIFAMVGGSPTHNEIVGNLYHQLRSSLEAGGCRPYLSTQRVAIRAVDLHTYPDISIVCGAVHLDAEGPQSF
jgi:Uma2 family endonuclease